MEEGYVRRFEQIVSENNIQELGVPLKVLPKKSLNYSSGSLVVAESQLRKAISKGDLKLALEAAIIYESAGKGSDNFIKAGLLATLEKYLALKTKDRDLGTIRMVRDFFIRNAKRSPIAIERGFGLMAFTILFLGLLIYFPFFTGEAVRDVSYLEVNFGLSLIVFGTFLGLYYFILVLVNIIYPKTLATNYKKYIN